MEGGHQFPRDHAQVLVAEHSHGTVVHFQRVVKGDLVVGEIQVLAALVSRAHVLCQGDQFFDHLRGFDGPIPILPHRGIQHLRELAG